MNGIIYNFSNRLLAKSLYGFIFACFFFSNLGCKKSNDSSASNSYQNNNTTIEIDPEKTTKDVSVKASYVTEGIIKNMSVNVGHELYYRNNKKVKEVQQSNSNGMHFKAISIFNDAGQLTEMKSYLNNKINVDQSNTYDDIRLIEEYRLEHDDGKIDTSVYRYLYPEGASNPLTYYRTNNRDTVTIITVDKTGNREKMIEKSYGYNFSIFTDKTLDQRGNVLEQESYSISETYGDPLKLDTSVVTRVVCQFDDNNNITNEVQWYDGKISSQKEFKYKNGILKSIIISKNNRAPKTVKYRIM